MKRKLLSFTIVLSWHVAVNSQIQGVFLNDWSPKSIHVASQNSIAPQTGAADATIDADYDSIVTKVPKYIYGHNANDYSGRYNADANMVKNVKNLQAQVIRFPGGNNANWYFWDRTPGNWPSDCPAKFNNDYRAGFINTNWQLNLTDYYQFLQQTNSTGIITVNYSYARYSTATDPVATAAHYAAQWVRYDNGRTKFWEVGNENYGNWQAGYEINTATNHDGQPRIITGDIYGKHFKIFADSMRAAAAENGHDIYIGAVGYDALTPGGGVIANWNEQVIPQIKNMADFYIVHNYYTNWAENTSAINILNSATNNSATPINTVYSKMAAYNCPMIPVVLTEWNINAKGSMQMVSDVNGMHADLVTGELIKNGYGLANRWGLANHWGGGDDHGMFAWGSEPGVPTFNPRPVFYHMYYFQKYFGDVMLASTHSGSYDIVAYASKFSTTKQAGVVVVNKSTSQKMVKINLTDFNYGTKFHVYTLTGDGSQFSRKVYVNGKTTSLIAGGPVNYDTISPASYSISDNLVQFTAPGRSSSYVLVESSDIPQDIQVSSIQFTKDTVSTTMKQTLQLNIKVYDMQNNLVNISPEWIVENGASVNANAVFYSEAPGKYRVIAKINDIADTTIVFVKPLKIITIGADTLNVEIGTTVHFSVQGFDENNFPVSVSPQWSVTGAGTIDGAGYFSATTIDTAMVYATYGEMKDSAVLIVFPTPPCFLYSQFEKIQAEKWCKMTGVQTEGTSDAGGGNNVGWIDNNDWMSYFIKLSAGSFNLKLRVASQSTLGKVTVTLEGESNKTIATNYPLVVTGGWQIWKDVVIPVTIDKAGEYNLKFTATTGGWNLNWLQFSESSSSISVVNQKQLTIYPNPLIGDELTICLPNDWQKRVSVRLVDLSNKTVMSEIVMSVNGKMNLKIPGNIPKGFYTLIIQYDNSSENTTQRTTILIK